MSSTLVRVLSLFSSSLRLNTNLCLLLARFPAFAAIKHFSLLTPGSVNSFSIFFGQKFFLRNSLRWALENR